MTDVDPELTRSLELVDRAQGGDLAALDRLFERYYERVLHIVRIRLGSRLKSYMEAEDIVQETFVTAVRNFERFEMRNEASLINWLAKMAEHKIHEAADYHHAQKRDRRREQALAHVRSTLASGTLQFDPPDPVTVPADAAGEAELRRIAEDCLAQLSDEHREVILLRLYAKGSWAWIAEQVGRPTAAAARELFRRARVALTRQMGDRIDLADQE